MGYTMRSRKEIMEDLEEDGFDGTFLQEELLLDIRDLLIKIDRKL